MTEFRLNRLLSRPLTRMLLRTPLTPNQVTTLTLVLGIFSGWLFSQGAYAAASGTNQELSPSRRESNTVSRTFRRVACSGCGAA